MLLSNHRVVVRQLQRKSLILRVCVVCRGEVSRWGKLQTQISTKVKLLCRVLIKVHFTSVTTYMVFKSVFLLFYGVFMD